MKVLIADDNLEECQSLAVLAVLHGHEVATCKDGIEVLNVAASFDPELIILDLDMPRMDGFETASRLQRCFPGSRWNLVAYSGRHSEALQRQAKDVGILNVYLKPDDYCRIVALLGGI